MATISSLFHLFGSRDGLRSRILSRDRGVPLPSQPRDYNLEESNGVEPSSHLCNGLVFKTSCFPRSPTLQSIILLYHTFQSVVNIFLKIILVEAEGLEPPTKGVEIPCAVHLRYAPDLLRLTITHLLVQCQHLF